MVINLKEAPLFTLVIKVMIPIFYKCFNPDAIIQNYHNIMQRINSHRYYRSAYYFISILLDKIPLVIISIRFFIPIQIIYRCYKNIVFANNASKT